MPEIYEYVFPKAEFNIRDYRASQYVLCTKALAEAIYACNKPGGGSVVITVREWLTGAIHLKSNVRLYLQEGAVLQMMPMIIFLLYIRHGRLWSGEQLQAADPKRT